MHTEAEAIEERINDSAVVTKAMAKRDFESNQSSIKIFVNYKNRNGNTLPIITLMPSLFFLSDFSSKILAFHAFCMRNQKHCAFSEAAFGVESEIIGRPEVHTQKCRLVNA